jgi:hypothetical protein
MVLDALSVDGLDDLSSAEAVRLHELAVRGLSPADPDEPAILRLQEAGLIRLARGLVRLTPAGRGYHRRWAELPQGSAARNEGARLHRHRFLRLNADILQLCTDWQMRGEVANDHSDRDYDASVVARLADHHDAAAQLLAELTRVCERFGCYGPQLTAAVRQARVAVGVEAADDWIVSPVRDSYHTVWMRLHEDLLRALAMSREAEAVLP